MKRDHGERHPCRSIPVDDPTQQRTSNLRQLCHKANANQMSRLAGAYDPCGITGSLRRRTANIAIHAFRFQLVRAKVERLSTKKALELQAKHHVSLRILTYH
jgi:predicted nucleic acid-binding Zn ribbon protein